MGVSGSPVELPFDDDTTVKGLSESDLRSVCKAGVGGMRYGYGYVVCSAAGLAQSLSEEVTCEAARSTCLAEAFDVSACDSDEVQPVDCDATVREIETCMNDVLQAAENLIPDLSCSSDVSDLQTIDMSALEERRMPASCGKIETKCGDLNLGLISLGADEDEMS